MCRDLGLEEIGYSREALIPKSHTSKNSFWILEEDQFRKTATELSQEVRRKLSYRNRQKLNECGKLFEETLMDLYRNKEIELRGQTDQLYNKVFERPQFIRTLTGINYHTERLLREKGWDRLFVVAETGEWLLAPNVIELLSDKEVEIYLIVADRTFEQELQKSYGVKLKPVVQLDWFDHNRHLTLVLDGDDPKEALYFTRRLRSPHINPVVLSGNDVDVVLDSFIAYWQKATRKKGWIGPSELDRGSFFEAL